MSIINIQDKLTNELILDCNGLEQAIILGDDEWIEIYRDRIDKTINKLNEILDMKE